MKWKVSVSCMTFNQSKFIEQTLNGFVMQQTNFPFVCTIVDDASTDGSQKVISDYLDRNFDFSKNTLSYQLDLDYAVVMFAPHTVNRNCFFAVLFLKENHYSINKDKLAYLKEWREGVKYIALCEGDDYWIDPEKLQKQYDFLEDNPDYTLCGSNGLILWDEGVCKPSFFNSVFSDRRVDISEVIANWFFPTASLFFRQYVLFDYPEWTEKIYSGDQTLILIAASKGKIHCFGSLTCVYRRSFTNNLSLTNATQNERMLQHHHLLYTEYNAYTHQKYQVYIEPKLKEIERRLEYVRLMNNKLLFFTNPFKFSSYFWEFFVRVKFTSLYNRLKR